MRRLYQLLLALLLLPLLLLPASALEDEPTETNSPEALLDGLVDPEEGLDESVHGQLGDFSADAETDLSASILRLLGTAIKSLSGSVRSGLLSAGGMLAAVLLASLLDTEAQHKRAVQLAAVLAIAGFGAGSVQSMLTLANDTVQQMREYSLLLLPGLSTLSVVSGGAATGAAVYTGSVVFFDVLLRLASGLVLPLVWLCAATGAANAAIGEGRLEAFSELLARLAGGILKWTGYLFTGYLAISGVLGGTTDAIRLRTAKAALSNAVPLVGGILSDASEALLSAAALLKNAVGVYGMLATLAICLAPFLRIAVQYGLLKGAEALSGLFAQPSLTGLIGRLAEAMRLLLALIGTFCMAALLSAVLLIKAVGM